MIDTKKNIVCVSPSL